MRKKKAMASIFENTKVVWERAERRENKELRFPMMISLPLIRFDPCQMPFLGLLF